VVAIAASTSLQAGVGIQAKDITSSVLGFLFAGDSGRVLVGAAFRLVACGLGRGVVMNWAGEKISGTGLGLFGVEEKSSVFGLLTGGCGVLGNSVGVGAAGVA